MSIDEKREEELREEEPFAEEAQEGDVAGEGLLEEELISGEFAPEPGGAEGRTSSKKKASLKKAKKKAVRKKAGAKKPEKEKARKLTKRVSLLMGGVFAAAGAAAVFVFLFMKDTNEEVPQITLPQITHEVQPEIEEETDIGSGVLDHIITAGNAVWDSFHRRPESFELTDGNASDFADVTECLIDPGTRKISVKAP